MQIKIKLVQVEYRANEKLVKPLLKIGIQQVK